MASLSSIISISKLACRTAEIPGFGFQQIRNRWPGWLMIRDVKRRRMNKECYMDRLRINAVQKNTILPPELRQVAAKEIRAFELNSTPLRINNRCVVTSRPRGLVVEWRLSRIVFRHLADYNKLSGVQRAMWGFS